MFFTDRPFSSSLHREMSFLLDILHFLIWALVKSLVFSLLSSLGVKNPHVKDFNLSIERCLDEGGDFIDGLWGGGTWLDPSSKGTPCSAPSRLSFYVLTRWTTLLRPQAPCHDAHLLMPKAVGPRTPDCSFSALNHSSQESVKVTVSHTHQPPLNCSASFVQ